MADRYAAMLFDLDGTLIDSMPLHQVAWRQWHADRALPFDEDGFFEATAGRSNDEILIDLFPALDAAAREQLADEKETLYRHAAAHSLAMIAGAERTLGRAREAGLRLAICTASPPANLRVALDRFGLGALVDTVTSPADRPFGGGPDDRLRGKPHPDIFVEAAHRLGVAPADCLVFEDAPLGIEAARRAGMHAVALTTTLPAAAFAAFDNLRLTLADFSGYDPAQPLRQEVSRDIPHA